MTPEGRLISLLADDHLEAGQHSVTWRGRNTQGSLVAAGIYLAKLDVEGQSLTQKITLAK